MGAAIIALGIVAFFIQLFVSIRDRELLKDETGDPWGGRTLEWSTSSPPPYYNFAFSPRVYALDAWHHMKQNGYDRRTEGYTPIHMPHYTATGIVISALLTVMGFALVWHIWWLAAATFIASCVYGVAHTYNYNRDNYVTVEEIQEIDCERTRLLEAYMKEEAAE